MKWRRKKRKQKTRRSQAPARGPRAHPPAAARAWRRRFRALLHIEAGNRRRDARQPRRLRQRAGAWFANIFRSFGHGLVYLGVAAVVAAVPVGLLLGYRYLRQAPHFLLRQVEVVGTAGAGDAYLAGILTGLAAGVSFGEAQALAALTAALSVTSQHTIDREIDRESLRALADTLQAPLPASICELLET